MKKKLVVKVLAVTVLLIVLAAGGVMKFSGGMSTEPEDKDMQQAESETEESTESLEATAAVAESDNENVTGIDTSLEQEESTADGTEWKEYLGVNQILWDEEIEMKFAEDCHFYVNFETDRMEYTEVDRDTFLGHVNDSMWQKSLRVQYENEKVINIYLRSIYNGLSCLEGYYDLVYPTVDGEPPRYDVNADSFKLAATYTADISDRPGSETITIYTGTDPQYEFKMSLLVVEGADGELLFMDSVDEFGHAVTSFYLGELDGVEYLMRMYIEDRWTNCDMYYNVIRFAENGEIMLLSGSQLMWFLEEERIDWTFSEENFKIWAGNAQRYLDNAEGILRKDYKNYMFELSWEDDPDWDAYGKDIMSRVE